MKNLNKLKKDCFKSLRCLYLVVDELIANDVNNKVKTYVEELERTIELIKVDKHVA